MLFQLPLFISSNERPKELINVIRRVVGESETKVTHLDCADYAVGEACVERKKVGNFVSSMVKEKGEKKELWDQLDRCTKAYQHPYLFLEGNLSSTNDPSSCYADGRYRQVGYLAVQAAICKVQDMGVTVVWTGDYNETAIMLKWIHSKYGGGR